MSKLTLERALISISQPLQPPADTERSLSERPKRLCNAADTLMGSRLGWALLTVRASRLVAHSLTSLLKLNFWQGQAGSQSPHSTQRPKSIWAGSGCVGSSLMARLGQTCTQAWHASAHAASLIRGLPRNPPGVAARRSGMYCVPWDFRTEMDLNMGHPTNHCRSRRGQNSCCRWESQKWRCRAWQKPNRTSWRLRGPAPCSAAVHRWPMFQAPATPARACLPPATRTVLQPAVLPGCCAGLDPPGSSPAWCRTAVGAARPPRHRP